MCIGINLSILLCACNLQKEVQLFQSEDLKIQQLTKNTFVHVSYIPIPKLGPFPCNGLVYRNGKEAVIFDTPMKGKAASALIKWVQEELKCEIKAIVINHFHIDCLGQLELFHEAGIPSYANQRTIELAPRDGLPIPQNGFEGELKLKLGNQTIINTYPGPGHTEDNIISYIPSEQVIFGGCLIKSVGAGKGNLADADVAAWSNTVAGIKQQYPDVQHIIPGHGKVGGIELLDFTMELFKQ